MLESIDLGFAPSAEIQHPSSCVKFKNLIIELFGNPPSGTNLEITNQGLICYFTLENPNYAFFVERNVPEFWK